MKFILLLCLSVSLSAIECKKSIGNKVDRAIEKVKEKVKDTYNDTKDKVKETFK